MRSDLHIADKVWDTPDVEKGSFFNRGAMPNTFLVGGQKCGSTSVLKLLAMQHNVSTYKRKELYYFSDKNIHQHSTHWYEKHFSPADVVIDGSANYFESPDAPKLISEYNSKAKVLVILRNPVHRAYSHYKMARSIGYEIVGFEEALRLEEERIALGESRKNEVGHNYPFQRLAYRTKGEYVRYLNNWQKEFPSMKVFILEELQESQAQIKELLDYCGVVHPRSLSLPHLKSTSKKKMNEDIYRSLLEHYSTWSRQLSDQLNRELPW